MQLHTISRHNENKAPRPRVGRGGKRGTTSGRGTKGQGSRSGHRIRPAIRDYIQRLPKMRGIKNGTPTFVRAEVSVDVLNKLKVSEVTLAVLKEHGLAARTATSAKILAGKELTKKLAIKGVAVSAGARKQIEAAGGTIA